MFSQIISSCFIFQVVSTVSIPKQKNLSRNISSLDLIKRLVFYSSIAADISIALAAPSLTTAHKDVGCNIFE